MYYAFYADKWKGEITLRGLSVGQYAVKDYFNDIDYKQVSSEISSIDASFEGFLLLEVTPLNND